MDKIVVFIILIVVIAAAGLFFLLQPKNSVTPTPLPEGIVLFYGDGCPHCKDVENFIAQNKIEEKLKITRLEVWYNKNNQLALGQVMQKCGIKSDTVGVPFLYDPPSVEAGGNGKCYIGEVDVPNFLKEKAGLNEQK